MRESLNLVEGGSRPRLRFDEVHDGGGWWVQLFRILILPKHQATNFDALSGRASHVFGG